MAGYLYDVLETIQEPMAAFEGKTGESLAAREIEPEKYIVAVYREVDKKDGFIITAFITRRWNRLERRKKIWQP